MNRQNAKTPGQRGQNVLSSLASWRLGGSIVLLFLMMTAPCNAGLTGTYFTFNNFAGERVTQVDRVMDFQ